MWNANLSFAVIGHGLEKIRKVLELQKVFLLFQFMGLGQSKRLSDPNSLMDVCSGKKGTLDISPVHGIPI